LWWLLVFEQPDWPNRYFHFVSSEVSVRVVHTLFYFYSRLGLTYLTMAELLTLVPSLQKASKSWKTFDWDNKSDQWEAALEASRESREAAQVARKQLAETTKTFKKVSVILHDRLDEN
jgi:hypothetical protein